MPAERRIALAGAENFRDLGGYRTADGRTVRWGRLYRSDNPDRLTSADAAALGALGLRLVCDLRTPAERAGRPSPFAASAAAAVVECPVDVPALDPERVRRRLLGGRVSPGELRDLLLAANRAYVADFAPQFGAVLGRLAEPGNLPALIHCAGGKDRTGFAAALALLAVGVPRPTVVEDYLLTNRYTRRTTRRRTWLVFVASRFAVRPREMRALLEARAEYLEAAFALMEARHGSIEGYLRHALGVTDERRARLRAALLT
jgi:protein-tyrosine phosphatase